MALQRAAMRAPMSFAARHRSYHSDLNLNLNPKRRAADFPSVMKLGSYESSDNKFISSLFAEMLVSTYSSSTFNIKNQSNITEEKTFDVSFIAKRSISKYRQQIKSS